MSHANIYEPDKSWSAIQAALLMGSCVLPLLLSFSLDHTVRSTPLTVAIVALPTPVLDRQEVTSVQNEIKESLNRQRQADIARRRVREKLQEEERKRHEEEKLRVAAEARQREEVAEKIRQEEERQRKKIEVKKLQEEERKRKEKKRKEEQLQTAAKAVAAREQAQLNRIKAAANQKIISRYISGIQGQVERHLKNPEGVTAGLQVEIRIRIGPNGHLLTAPEQRSSSGNEQFDEQALRAVLRSAQSGFQLPQDPELQSKFNDVLLVISPKLDN